MRWAMVWLCGCAFQPGTLPADASPSLQGDADGAAMTDASATACSTSNELRACYMFDGNTLDGSTWRNDAVATSPA